MNIVLECSRCRHCEHMCFWSEDESDLEIPICEITGFEISDNDSCDKFSMSSDIKKELKETLGFKNNEIKIA